MDNIYTRIVVKEPIRVIHTQYDAEMQFHDIYVYLIYSFIHQWHYIPLLNPGLLFT
jgi:hypothetical protein